MGKRAQKAEPAKQPYVTIAAAGYGEVSAEFAFSLAAAMRHIQYPVRLDYESSCYVHLNRNKLLDRAIKLPEATHLMFIDTDIAFPRDGVDRLLAHGKPIIGGNYYYKREPKDGRRESTVKALSGVPTEIDKSKPFEAAAIPTGFMLIDLEVMRGLVPPPPMGDHEGNPLGGPPRWFDFGNYAGFVGEDVYFCHLVREQGVPIWCDPTIPLGHVGRKIY